MPQLRPARPDEAGALTALCLRSKAVHGYDDPFMAACREELRVDPRRAGSRPVVAEEDLAKVGLAEISIDGSMAELEKLFVEPAWMGRGIGRVLFEWARREAQAAGARSLSIASVPGARAFYLAMGAVDDGVSASRSIPGRFLPRLRVELGIGGAE